MKEYTTDKKLKFVQFRKFVAIGLILISIYLFFIQGVPDSFTFEKLGDYLMSLLFFSIGISFIANAMKVDKELKGQGFTIDTNSLTVTNKGNEYVFSPGSKPNSIVYIENTLNIETKEGEKISIYFENYPMNPEQRSELDKQLKRIVKKLDI